jgi:hypothetical protein
MNQYKLSEDDLNFKMSFAVVCYGKMRDYIELKEVIKKKFPEVKINFTTAAPEYLFVLKKSVITPKQLDMFKKMSKSQKNVKPKKEKELS